MSIYLVGQRLGKKEFLGTSAWFFFLVNLSKLPLFIGLGMITPETLRLDAVSGSRRDGRALVGARLLRRIPQRVFTASVLLLAGLAGLRLLLG